MNTSPAARARRVAAAVLRPAAERIDRLDAVPSSVLRLLADEALNGPFDRPTRFAVTEALAAGSLSVAFVHLQHLSALATVCRSEGPAARFAEPLARGEMRAGIAITALRGSDPLRITPSAGGYALTGTVPWITGWGRIDLLFTAALGDGDLVHRVLLDVRECATLSVVRQPLEAANASDTVTARFEAHPVPAERLVGLIRKADLDARDAAGLAGNGALATGTIAAMLHDAGPSGLDGELIRVRERLLAASPGDLPEARADAGDLAVRAAALLAVRTGSATAVAGSRAARAAREAQFLLVFGSRPSIRAALESRLIGG